MKSGILVTRDNLNAEMLQCNRQLEELHQKRLAINQEIEKIKMMTAAARESNHVEDKDKQLLARYQVLASDLTEIDQRYQFLYERFSQLEKAKEYLEIQQLQKNLRPRIQDYLTKITGISWIEEAKYGEGRIVSAPFDDLEKAKQFHDLFCHQIDNQSTVQKSPRGEYYRVFANKDSVLDCMVNQELRGGFALDLSVFFQNLKEEESELKKDKP